MEGEELNQGRSAGSWVLIILITLIIVGALGYVLWRYFQPTTESETTPSSTENTSQEEAKVWSEGGVAISGKYADADVVAIEGDKYRMYYSAEPETANFQGQMYSATSTDGINWTQESGTRMIQATFPDAVKLADGTWRMYFQKGGVIKSATSPDGLTWTDEAGTRIDATESNYTITQVAAPTTIKLADGTFLMVYSGTVNQPYSSSVRTPNSDTRIFFYATSTDGVTWTKKGVALNTKNDTLMGFADGPDLVDFDGTTRLYFWGYAGVYHLIYSNGAFSTEPIFDYTNEPNSAEQFPENPPGDPTLIKINNVWYMYYGQHTKGIYYAILGE